MMNRREVLKLAGTGVLLSTLSPFVNLSFPSEVEEKFKKHVGVPMSKVKDGSDKIKLKTPTIAETGANVPVSVDARIPVEEVDWLMIFVDHNPVPRVIKVHFSPMNGRTFFATRIKMAKTSNVRAIIKKKDGSYLQALKEVKVTIGGCG